MRWVQKFVSIVDDLSETLGRLVSWTTLIIVLVGSWNAITRYFSRSTGIDFHANALQDAQWYLFSAMFLLGASYALKRDEHVRVDVIYHRLSHRAQLWINLVGHIAFLIPFCCVVIWASWRLVVDSWSILEGSPDPGGLPRYVVKTMIPIGFACLLLQGVAETIKTVIALRRGDSSAGGAS